MFAKQIDNILVIHCELNRLDASLASSVKRDINDILNKKFNGYSSIIIDLKNIEFMDNSGLSVFVFLFKSLNSDIDFALCGLHKNLKNLFNISHIDYIIPTYEDISIALETLQRPKYKIVDAAPDIPHPLINFQNIIFHTSCPTTSVGVNDAHLN